MILVLQKNTPEPAIRQLLAQLALQNVKGGCVAGETSLLLPLVGETWRLDPAALQALPYVQEARRLTPAYHLAARSAHPENTVVPVGDVRVGADFCRKFTKFIFTNLVEKVYRCVVNGRFPGTLGKHRKSAYILFY